MRMLISDGREAGRRGAWRLGCRRSWRSFVDEACGKAGFDDVGVAQGAAPALGAHDPDGAIGLDPGLELVEPSQTGCIFSPYEDEVDFRSRFAGDDVRGPLLQQLDEARILEVDDRDLRSWLHAQLVKQRSRRP